MSNSIRIIKTESIDYLQFNKLLEFQDKLTHAIFLKKHNIGFNLKNDIEVRNDALNRISKIFKISKEHIIQAHQTHSNSIREFTSIQDINKNILNDIDGYIANVPQIASIITFADCIPIFIYDCKNNIYSNIHSGWRGVINQISIKAIKILTKKYNSNPTNLICCIGPNIRKECFLVNEDLITIYKKTYGEIIKKYPIIQKTDLYNEKGKQYRIDNNLLLKILFEEIGILDKNIIDSEICTVCNSDDFHSRRVEGENFQKGGGLMMLK